MKNANRNTSNNNLFKQKRKRYKLFLDPTYNEFQVSETTARRWRKMTASNASTSAECSQANMALCNNQECHQPNDNNYQILDESFGNSRNSTIIECTESQSIPNAHPEFHETIDDDHHTLNAPWENYRDSVQDNLTEGSSESEESSEDECITSESTREQFTARDHTIMFEASGITVEEACDMVIALSIRFEWTKEATSATMNLAKVFARPRFYNINLSCHNTENKFSAANTTYSFIYYCSKCNCLLTQPLPKNCIKNTVILCAKCHQENTISLNSDNHFIYVNIEHQISILLSNKDIYKELIYNIKVINNKSRNNSSSINDLYDSQIYKSKKSVIKQNKSKESIVLTYNFNTDGAPVFKSSKKSFWPLQLSINEFSPEKRFKNLILIALCVVKNEPSHNFMNIFLKYFVDKAQKLSESGFIVENYIGQEINVKLVPLFGIVDSVARPILQNRVQFNGYYGCSWCYQEGTYLRGCVRYCIFTSIQKMLLLVLTKVT